MGAVPDDDHATEMYSRKSTCQGEVQPLKYWKGSLSTDSRRYSAPCVLRMETKNTRGTETLFRSE